MRLNIRTKNNYSYYTIIKDYTNLNGTRTTTIFEKLGNQQQVEERFGKVNTIENIKKYIEELNNENKEEIINVQFNPNKTIERNIKKRFNIGYLFLKKIYNELKIKDICNEIEKNFEKSSYITQIGAPDESILSVRFFYVSFVKNFFRKPKLTFSNFAIA